MQKILGNTTNTGPYTENLNNNIISEQDAITVSQIDNNIWNLKIPKIELNAQIEEDTTQDVLKEFIGHFKQTSKWDGNIGLAAHNRGYENNYFKDIKNLEYGDEIEYYYNGGVKKYQVSSKKYISNTDWSQLMRTKENKITLITCIENKPQYRLCIQATEIQEE